MSMRKQRVTINFYLGGTQHVLVLDFRTLQRCYLNAKVKIQDAWYRVVGLGFEGDSLACHVIPCL